MELKRGRAGFGGATVEDAVVMLRRLVAFPVCIEFKEFRRDTDGLTLGAAIHELHSLKDKQSLTLLEEYQLKRYEELAGKQSLSTLVGFREQAFILVEDNITVQALLDRVITLDSTYLWRNDGTVDAPIIVIQPREKSALEWLVAPICKAGEELTSSTNVYGPDGRLTLVFQEHDISELEISRRRKLPDVKLNLCVDRLTARDVLNMTIKAAGDRFSWSLSGIEGQRWLVFQ